MEKLRERLKGNLNKYRPIPFWSWNGKLEGKELCRQIDKMKQWGMGGYFMHARSGLITDYLSEDWVDCVKCCADHGEKEEMTSWIYDENGYPSGFAGGKLLEKDEYHDRYITHNIGKLDGNADISYIIEADRLVRAKEQIEGKEYLNLYFNNSVGTADVLNKEVVDGFLELTHEMYKKSFGNSFSDKISGFFTDEPQYYCGALAYSNAMPEYYRERYGEDIFDSLGLLVTEKEGFRKFRYRYWKSMNELLVKNYSETVYNWCENNGVRLTGHYVEETTLGFQMRFCAGVMPMYEYMHIPGIDWLGSGTDNPLSPRQVASVAAQMGKRQILTESYAACGWHIKPRDLKRVAEFQFLNGVNLLCHHLVPYSEYGIRKHDHPSHFSQVNPWIDLEFRSFNDYFTRLGYLIAESDESVNVALLHPIRSAYFDFDSTDYGSFGFRHGLEKQDRFLKEDLRLLSKNGISYHFLDESLLAKYGFVNGGVIGCGKKEYDFLIVPHIEAMDRTTEALVRKFAENGGKILILGDAPKYLEGEEFDFSYLKSNCSLEEIIMAQPFRIENRDTEIYTTYRIIDGKRFIFIQNASVNTDYTQAYSFSANVNSFERLDLETLESKRVPLEISLKAGESALLFLSDEELVEEIEKQDYYLNLENSTAEFDENNLTVDMVSYSKDGKEYSEKIPCDALVVLLCRQKYRGKIYLRYEFDVKKVPEKIALLTEQRDFYGQTLNGNALTFTDRREYGENLLSADVTAFVRQGKNEYVVEADWVQDQMVDFTLEGDNILGSLGNKLTYVTEISPIFLRGDFGVYSNSFTEGEYGCVYADEFYIAEKPKIVSEPVFDGLPFFVGSLTLRKTVSLSDNNIRLHIKGTQLLTYVKVNGKYAGKLMFNEYLDISNYASVGENEIEVQLIMGNRNLFGPFHYNGIAHFGVGPNHFDMRVHNWEGNTNPDYRPSFELLKLNNN